MSSPTRRKELKKQFELDQEAQRKEDSRKDAFQMRERIAEADASESVKDILRRLADKLGVLY